MLPAWTGHSRLLLLAFAGLIASSLYLVHTQHRVRTLYVELERAQAEARRLEVVHDQLQIRKRAEGTPLKVERVARDRLEMRPAVPAVTHFVSGRPDAGATTGGRP